MMVVLVAIILLFIWFYIGWIFLAFIKNEDSLLRGLLSPTVGMAVVIFIVTTASLLGMPIKYSSYIVIFFSIILLYFIKFDIWKGFISSLSINLILLLCNFLITSIGLFLYGYGWQGLINADAAINSLAAQYFISNSFFSEPSIELINQGIDYSSLAAMLYVIEGHRFGDVMLLGFSSSLFRLNPDEVYMVHALIIRCALIASAVALIYQKIKIRIWSVLIAILILSISPLGIYTYLNQLISQLGGLALTLVAIILISRIFERSESTLNLAFLVSITIAALNRYYPESIPYLALSIIIYGSFTIYNNRYFDHNVLKLSGLILAFVVLFTNVSIPMVFSHLLRQMGSVGRNQNDQDSIVLNDFGYAFQPDSLSLFYGFQALREQVNDPWATIILVISIILSICLIIFSIRNFTRYSLVISLCASGLIMLLYLSIKESGFGAFKMMLHLQPIVFALFAAMVNEALIVRNILMISSIFILVIMIGRVAFYYVAISVRPSSYNFAQNHFLDKVQKLVSDSPKGAILYSPNFLFGEFALLREKKHPLFFEQNFPKFIAGRKYFSRKTFIDSLLPDGGTFPGNIEKFYSRNYNFNKFDCESFKQEIVFNSLHHSNISQEIPYIIPGGKLIPLNRLNYYADFLVIDKQKVNDVLMFQPSSLGEYYGVNKSPSIFNLESDLFIDDGSIAGVGRFMLLEIFNPSDDNIQIKIGFSRTIFSGQAAKLPSNVTIYGEKITEIDVIGSGAMNFTSIPLQPCNIDGKKYVLIDFGIEPNYFDKNELAPWVYQYFNVPYVPDLRKLSGFLRDISIAPKLLIDNKFDISLLRNNWNFKLFNQLFEFSGIYEDGWMSDQIKLQLNSNINFRKMVIKFEVPNVSNYNNNKLSIYSDGYLIQQISLKSGSAAIDLDKHLLTNKTLKIIIDKPLILPNGDDRSVSGLIKSFWFEK